MPVVTALRVNLALTCVESALYGAFVVLAVTSLVVLIARHGKDTGLSSSLSPAGVIQSPLCMGTVMLLITVTGHWITTVIRLYEAIRDETGGTQASAYYLTVEAKPHVVATAFVVASVIVGDIILTYRIWVVWHRKFSMIIFPILCTLGYTATGTSVVELFAIFNRGESIFVRASQKRIITTAALTLSTNVYGTVSIAYRIWVTNRAMKHGRMKGSSIGLYEALVIFIESAALYTSWTLFFLVSYSASSLLETFAFHCIPVVTGISFMLIIVRVGLGFSWSEDTGESLGVTTRVPVVGRLPTRGQDSGEPYPLRMITLNVTRTVERETDFALPQSPGDKGRRGSVDETFKDLTKDRAESV
ncbi:hypothetical protein BD309DRAFT_1053997 [Dichomitus squalens]|uniref:Uncharacterized protein n=2 Tax=Dichomitus squalens TaxID=114155 RepID=A0A4Q9NH50_9APHY|nr:uncharacterized protein DICSQDRAFT_181961 [Dichomitus squalens LYAD-421 SS1]EJF59455.1 hypothetical protein DICSQDRAFT_181961 [Dichomitus squalens LYAD-421 SS1]TBU38952.1 hypothetical protein BD309DRAFT_1053997 [Dichomitus squalens]TBU58909.1 hypothetical protein BD310DRAFT_439248 [Dichomitus squalens]